MTALSFSTEQASELPTSVLHAGSSSACRSEPTKPESPLNRYVRDLGRVGAGECFFDAMGRIRREALA
jgi:hypothetical protein